MRSDKVAELLDKQEIPLPAPIVDPGSPAFLPLQLGGPERNALRRRPGGVPSGEGRAPGSKRQIDRSEQSPSVSLAA